MRVGGRPIVVGRIVRALALVCATVLIAAAPALAYDEITSTAPPLGHVGPYDECTSCHGDDVVSSQDCYGCHGPASGFPVTAGLAKGPHAGVTSNTDHCQICHTIHNAPSDFVLLPAPTITATCETCHDGTGGRGVYGAIQARTGMAPQAAHRCDTTRTVPGGDPFTGGSREATFSGVGFTLSCTDCHNPHDANTVAPFTGERRRVAYTTPAREAYQYLGTNRLLRNDPGSSATTVAAYGSDWCLACHAGRTPSGMVNNHPIDSVAERADSFTYNNAARLASDDLTSAVTTGTLGGSNTGYLMPVPRAAAQGTHEPICQQCHEDSRNVGVLSGASADAATFTVSLDGTVTTSNPRFQNFPHETVNRRFLVESADDLCLNCHEAAQLP